MVNGNYVSPSEITCITPPFEEFGAKEAVVQVMIGTEDITTTWTNFQYFLNTRAKKSLCYGPGLLSGVCPGHPTEFTIQARNDENENRTSGRDTFEVKVVRRVPIEVEKKPAPVEGEEQPAQEEAPEEEVEAKPKFKEVEIPCEVHDTDDGKYNVTYTSEDVGEVFVYVNFLDENGKLVPVRGSPYKASFVEGAKKEDNLLGGGCMDKYIKKDLERLTSDLAESKKEINSKDKDLKNVKALLKVKENVERCQRETDAITLQIDQLEESLKLFQSKKLAKDAQIKQLTKLKKEWVDVKKITKDAAKEIAPYVANEGQKNTDNIKKLEESITQFTADMKKREFFQYNCGTDKAK